MRKLRTWAMLALVIGACARAYPPPGGEQDRTPPRLIGTTPEPLIVAPDFKEAVVFRFDERLSERGFTESLVVVSPLDDAIRVERGGREISVSLEGGWRRDRVYRVIVLPGLRDLFGNARDAPVELVFSTGPPVPNTAIGGIVQDRLTERAAQNGVITALRRADSVSYMTVADSGGFFALRHLPFGVYELRAFADQNRNRRRDAAEPVDSGRVVSLGTDTLTEVFSVLAADTSPARLRTAESVDSLHVRLTFDDYLDPVASLADLRGQVVMLPDSVPHAQVVSALHPALFEQQRRQTAPPDTTTRQPGDTTQRNQRQAQRIETRPGPILPSRDLVVRLDKPVSAGTEFVITVVNVTNINGLGGGGGRDDFDVRTAPVMTLPRRDTVGQRSPR